MLLVRITSSPMLTANELDDFVDVQLLNDKYDIMLVEELVN